MIFNSFCLLSYQILARSSQAVPVFFNFQINRRIYFTSNVAGYFIHLNDGELHPCKHHFSWLNEITWINYHARANTTYECT